MRDHWLRLLAAEESRLVRLHERLADEVKQASEAPDLRRKAEALLIHAKEIRRGAREFTCPDPNEPRETLRIDLDPRVSAAGNADALFRRVRRLERGASLRAKRIRALEEAIARLAVLRGHEVPRPGLLAEKGGTWLREALGPFRRDVVLAAWKELAAREGVGSSGRAAPRTEPSGEKRGQGEARAGRRGPAVDPPAARAAERAEPGSQRGGAQFHPRSFKTREGWTVIVGRSNRENDYVTHRLAKPDDYWFHVHGCPGSHVVLRREGRKDNPSARTIEETAAIAAFFSKARTSRKAPVIYTLKKYVRKPRGGTPGLALVTRERTIMVVPAAPLDAGPAGWGDDE